MSNNEEKIVAILLQNYDRKLIEMITGKLLGDGNLTIEDKKSPRLRFGHTTKDRLWCVSCYQNLSEFIKLSPPKFRRVPDSRLISGYFDQYYVQSKCNDIYTLLKELWYPHGSKKLPKHLISEVLTPLCLSWWYQDDGHLKVKNNTPQKVILSTESFTPDEIVYLKDLFHIKFNMSFTIDKQKRLVLYDKPTILYFLNIVRPHIVTCMNRKDIFSKPLDPTTFPRKHRTSLYISSSIQFKNPSKEIRDILSLIIRDETFLNNTINIYHDYVEHFPMNKKVTKAYQIELNREELYYLALFQQRTGLTKGECIEYCYLYKNGHL